MYKFILGIVLTTVLSATAATTNVRIYHQAQASLATLQKQQIGVNTTSDANLGFKMWGGKDADGNVTQWLAKDKNARVLSMRQDSSFSKVDTSWKYKGDTAHFIAGKADRFYYGTQNGTTSSTVLDQSDTAKVNVRLDVINSKDNPVTDSSEVYNYSTAWFEPDYGSYRGISIGHIDDAVGRPYIQSLRRSSNTPQRLILQPFGGDVSIGYRTDNFTTGTTQGSIFSWRDTAAIMKADSGNFGKLVYGTLEGVKMTPDTIVSIYDSSKIIRGGKLNLTDSLNGKTANFVGSANTVYVTALGRLGINTSSVSAGAFEVKYPPSGGTVCASFSSNKTSDSTSYGGLSIGSVEGKGCYFTIGDAKTGTANYYKQPLSAVIAGTAGVPIYLWSNARVNNGFSVDTSGVIVLQRLVWDDMGEFNLATAKNIGATGGPTLTSTVNGFSYPAFAVNDSLQGTVEHYHRFLQGTGQEYDMHFHYKTNGSDGTARGVKFSARYIISNINDSCTYIGTVSAEDTIPANTKALTHRYIHLGDVSVPNVTIGSYITVCVKRITAAATAPSANPFGLNLGVHAKIDGLGSRSETTK